MAALRVNPYSLIQGAKIITKIRANNAFGWSALSDATDSTSAAVL